MFQDHFVDFPTTEQALDIHRARTVIGERISVGSIVIVNRGRKIPVGTYGVAMAMVTHTYGDSILVLNPGGLPTWVSSKNLEIFHGLTGWQCSVLYTVAGWDRAIYTLRNKNSGLDLPITQEIFLEVAMHVDKLYNEFPGSFFTKDAADLFVTLIKPKMR